MEESSIPQQQTAFPVPNLVGKQQQKTKLGKSLFDYQRSQWIIFIIMGLMTSFIFGLVRYIPLQYVSDQTGLVWTQWKFMLAVFIPIAAVGYCLVIPIVGRYYVKLGGPYKLFTIGCFLMGVALICNGFIQFIQSVTLLIVVLFGLGVIRIIGDGTIHVISIAVTTFQFSKFIGTVFGIIQFVRLLARSYCSRRLSSYLYEVGPVGQYSFILPFSFFGGLLLLLIPISIIFLRKYDLCKTNNAIPNEQSSIEEESQIHDHQQRGFLRLLKLQTTQACIFIICCATFSFVFLSTVVNQPLWHWTDAGSIYFTYFAKPISMLALPVSGLLCDKKFGGSRILINGTVLILFGSICLGPLSAFVRGFWLYLIGLTFLLVGTQVVTVSSFVVGVEFARQHGYPDSVATNALVLGLWEIGYGVGGNLGTIFAAYIIIDSPLYIVALSLQFIFVLSATFAAGFVNDKSHVDCQELVLDNLDNTLPTEC